MLYGVDEDYILRHWAVETINRKLVHGVEFDLTRRGLLGQSKDPEKLPPLTKQEAEALHKEYLPKWEPRPVK